MVRFPIFDDEHGDVQADQLLGERAHPLAVAIRPAVLNRDVSPLGETTPAWPCSVVCSDG